MRASMFTLLILSMLFTTAHSAERQERADARRKAAIAADELNTRYVVHGPLGFPLGAVITIVGEPFENTDKGERNQIRVTAIEGRALQQPVVMPCRVWPWGNGKSLLYNAKYELRVFQDGGFTGVPGEVMKETVAIQTTGYAFTTNLVIVNSIRQLTAPRGAAKIIQQPDLSPPPLEPRSAPRDNPSP